MAPWGIVYGRQTQPGNWLIEVTFQTEEELAFEGDGEVATCCPKKRL